MHRLAPAIVVLVLLTACGKKVPAAPSAASPRNASELQGMASYYSAGFNGRPTASGEIFDTYNDMTAAHRTLPFNSIVKVTNQENGRNVDVRINDRGPFVEGRVIDLSMKAARELDMVRSGIVPVKLTVLREGPPAPPAPPARTRPEAQAPNSPAAVYTIQVGAFGSQDAAEALKKDLEGRYKNVTIQTVTAPQTLYRVRVGRLPDLNAAEDLMKVLRDEKFDPFVVRLN